MSFSPAVEEALKALSLLKTWLPSNHILKKILVELLDLIDLKDENGNNKIIIESVASNQPTRFSGKPIESSVAGFTQGLYRCEQHWGAYIVVKERIDLVSILVHELTHASCFLKYRSDMVNFQPKKEKLIPYTHEQKKKFSLPEEKKIPTAPPEEKNIPGAPDNVYCMDFHDCYTAALSDMRWYDKNDEAFLFVNLSCLEQWADVTDFGSDGLADNRFPPQTHTFPCSMAHDIGYRDVKYYITYAKYASNGRIQCHAEYDAVINQMLLSMFQWKWFDPWNLTQINPNVSWGMLGEWIRDRKVPTWYFCSLAAELASEAYNRREQASLACQQESLANGAKSALDRRQYMDTAQRYRTEAKIKNPRHKIIPSPFMFINTPEPLSPRKRKNSLDNHWKPIQRGSAFTPTPPRQRKYSNNV